MTAEDATKPRWDLKDAIRRGEAAENLGTKNSAIVVPRLDAGALEGLRADLGLLKGAPEDRGAAGTGRKAATGAERDAAAEGADWIGRVREMGRRTKGFGKGDRKAIGIGEKVDPRQSGKVRSAIASILKFATDKPDVARSIGMIPEDLAEGQGLLVALAAAENGQSAATTLSTEKTFNKDVVQLRVEAAIDQISARGAMAARKNAPLRARFEALVSSTGPAAEDQPQEGAPQA